MRQQTTGIIRLLLKLCFLCVSLGVGTKTDDFAILSASFESLDVTYTFESKWRLSFSLDISLSSVVYLGKDSGKSDGHPKRLKECIAGR